MKVSFRKCQEQRIRIALIGLSMIGIHLSALSFENEGQAYSSNRVILLPVKGKSRAALPSTVSQSLSDTVKRSPITDQMKIGGSMVDQDTLNIKELNKSPFISLQQYLKGNIAGVYVQENNGEPGTIQSMSLRGLPSPVFSNRDLAAVQPAVYVNGIPLIQNHPFTYDVKQYDINPNGSASNLLAGLDLNNIESVQVIKDPVELAKLGPLAANGAIWIVTKNSQSKGTEKVTLDFGYGVTLPPERVKPTNGVYERNFRKQFYDAYGLPFENKDLPSYLRDENDVNYNGNADWANSYYGMGQQYKANAAIQGGGEIANMLFTVGSIRNAGITDNTNYAKNSFGFFMTMKPLKKLKIKGMIYGAMANRKRNNNLRDRYAEVEYLPDFTFPIAPYGNAYRDYLSLNDESVDKNKTNFINGYLKADYSADRFNFGAEFLFDYNIDTRHVFWPSTLMESISFISDYSGFNRRVVVNGYGGYKFNLGDSQSLAVKLTGGFNGDLHDYNYTRAYDGSSDKYKTTTSGSYKTNNYLDREQGRLVTSSLNLNYSIGQILDIQALLRYDGYSKMQSDNRWLFTPAFSANWNLKNHVLTNVEGISKLLFSASWSRVGKMIGNDRFSLGPNYTSDNMNWLGQSVIPSYVTFATVSRPYKDGWLAYDISWPYAEKLNLSLNGSFFNNLLDVGLSFYDNHEREMIVPIPVPEEYGYSYQYLSGMGVNNKGVDFRIASQILNNPNGLKWRLDGNLNFNVNKLTILPNGLQEMEFGDRKLEVGKSIDQFWVYENNGVFDNNNQVPVVGATPLSYSKIPFKAGDPIWKDKNADNSINSLDKVLKGHTLPRVTGGLTSGFVYKNFDLNFNFFFALGHSTLNLRDSRRYDFKTIDSENSLRSVREIFSWQNTNDGYRYPIYNPNSGIDSYRVDQDLFLQSLSYLKLRTVSLGYNLHVGKQKKKATDKNNMYTYLTANNIWTLTKFKGGDPELVDFNGYFTGYGQNLPFTASLGVRYKF